MGKQQPSSVFDFFNDDKFIEWRLNSKELDSYWEQFAKDNPQLKSLLDEAIRKFDAVKINDYALSPETEKTMYNELIVRIQEHRQKKKRRILTYSLSAAATAALLIISATFLLVQKEQAVPVDQDVIVGKARPSSDIQLITGEKTVTLAQNADITVSEQGSASITDSTRKQETLELSKNEMNRLIVPYGKRSYLELADGTKVWLNSGTELDFPTSFTTSSRDIKVVGEIYIEVAKSDKQFWVHTEQATIRVVGTKFNITAYEGESAESITLVEGSVQVNTLSNKEVKLAPNELLTVSGENMEVKTVNVSEYISWRKGVLEFDKAPFSEILKKIGRYYNVDFETNADKTLNNQTCSGKLYLSNNLDSTMTSVSIISSTAYSRKGSIIHIIKE